MQILISLVSNFIAVLCKMAPYLLLGFLMAGILYVVIPASLIGRYLGRNRRFRSVINSALIGVPMPLCSCSVIPVVTSLRQNGASKGATISFLLSAPQTGADSFMVTFGMLGPVIAVFRVIAALISGIIGGLAVELLAPAEEKEYTQTHCTACCHEKEKQRIPNPISQVLRYGFVFMPRELAAPIVLGTVIAALITIIVPVSFVEKHIGTGITGILVTMAFGIPMYVCATGSVPIAAVLLAKGASAGAVFAFLMVGPATNAATITVIWKLLRTKSTIIYLVSLMIVAFVLGILLNNLISMTGNFQQGPLYCNNPSVLERVLCVVLCVLFAGALLTKR